MRVMPSSVEGLVFEGDGLEPGTHAELMQRLNHVIVDSSWTDTELLRDRFGREAGPRSPASALRMALSAGDYLRLLESPVSSAVGLRQ